MAENNPAEGEQVPEDDRQHLKHPTNYCESLVHLLKGCIGSGIYALGDGFKNCGLVLGSVLLVFIGLACGYCEHILLRCSKTIKEKKELSRHPDFAETVELCFEEGPLFFQKYAKLAGVITYTMIILMQLGFCCVYILFLASTSKHILDSYEYYLEIRVHMCIMLIPLILSSLIRSLKYLVPISFIANICITFGITATMTILFQDLPPMSERDNVGDLANIPLFFGTAVYSYEAVGLVLPLKREMKKPEHFDSPFGVLNVGLLIIITVFWMMGFFSYLKYGDEIEESVTLNLPQDSVLSELVRISIGIGILFTYALMFYVPIQMMWPKIAAKYSSLGKSLCAELSFRIFMVFVTVIIAACIPHLALFISLIGSFSSAFLSFVVPTTCDLLIRWPSTFGTLKWRLILDIFALILSVIGVTSGTYYSLKAIVLAFIE